MIRQIRKQTISEAVRETVTGAAAVGVIVGNTIHGCAAVDIEGDSLYLSIPSERNAGAAAVTKALWEGTDVPLALTAEDGSLKILRALPDRCHISGKVFARFYMKRRHEAPGGDISCVWEMTPDGLTAPDPAVVYSRQETAATLEDRHLDHEDLRAL